MVYRRCVIVPPAITKNQLEIIDKVFFSLYDNVEDKSRGPVGTKN